MKPEEIEEAAEEERLFDKAAATEATEIEAERAELVPADPTPTDLTVPAMLRYALEQGNMDGVERMVALMERQEDRAAERALAAALAAFQRDCPEIVHNKQANIVTANGGAYSYSYAQMGTIIRAIKPALGAHGLAVGWHNEQLEGNRLRVVCTVRHSAGASVSADFVAPCASNNKTSELQKQAAGLTFGRRQSLMEALGLATAEAPDVDGAEVLAEVECITDEQLFTLEEWMSAVNANPGKFAKYMGVKSLAQLPAAQFAFALKSLQDKQKKEQA
jgi:hypothetical protein